MYILGRKSPVWSSASSLLVLSAPVVASQASSMMVSVADTFMVGHLDEASLAAVSLAGNLMVPTMFLGIGIASTVTPLVGRRLGRGRKQDIATLVSHARRLNWVLALLHVVASLLLTVLLPYMGQPAEVVDIVRGYLPILGLSMVGQQMFVCCRTLCEGLQDTLSPMRIGLAGNIFNIFLNYFLIFGIGSWNGFGVYGAVVSTFVARTLMWIAMEVVLKHRLRSSGIYHVRSHRSLWRRVFAIGFPVGLQAMIECIGFAFGGIMMGWISTEAIAAHQVVNLFTSLNYLMAGGVATAVTIKVSISCGASNFVAARRFAKVGIAISAIFMACCSILLVILRDVMPGWILDTPETLSIASSLMLLGAVFQVFDGVHVTTIGALRGFADFSFPAKASSAAFILTGIPVSYLVGFVFDAGPNGVWVGYAVGLFVAASLLLIRLRFRFLYQARI